MAERGKNDALQGTLNLLILKTLSGRPLHGYAIASQIQRTSEELLRVEEGSLYPALHRMEQDGWIESDWGLTETNRKACFYKITAAGRKQLRAQLESFHRTQRGIALILGEA